MQAEKTEITERVSKIVFMDARLPEAVASWQGNSLIDADAHRDNGKRFVVRAGLRLIGLTSWRNFSRLDAGLCGLLYRQEVRVCPHVCMVGLQRLHILDQLLLLLWCQIRPKVMTGVGIPL